MSEARSDETERPTERDLRIGEALNDWLDRRKRGESVSEEELINQHPELAEDLRRHVRFLRGAEHPDNLISQLVACGVLQQPADGQGQPRLGAYRITAVLGRGGMGAVLNAHDDRLDRPVALKVLRPDLTNDGLALKRFAREAKAAAALQHPNVVALHAVAAENGTHYISMEYVDGPSLAELIKRDGPLPPRVARHIFSQILSGLAAAHAAGLIHRDIKPSNILLARRSTRRSSGGDSEAADDGLHWTAKLADFGLARMATARTRMTTEDSILGTPEYMSPEQARGEESLDHRTDLYSAGVVLYEMLIGRTPFKADRPSAVIHRILTELPPDPRTQRKAVDASLASLAVRLMAKEPEDRFDDAEDALAALAAERHVVSVEALRHTRRRVLLAVMGVAAAVGAIWLGEKLLRAPPITDVKVDLGDENLRSSVLARRGGSTEWEVFHDFGPGVTTVRRARMLDWAGDGQPNLVVACTAKPVDGASVFGFDLSGTQVWSWDPTPAEAVDWPDYDEGPTHWICTDVMMGQNLDDVPGDELVIVAREANEYASRISVLVEENGGATPVSTFWHMGHISRVRPVTSATDKKTRILAWGVNNKLDGFVDPHVKLTSETAIASYDIVPFVVLLDPASMNGIGPPSSTFTSLPPAACIAYAYLDLLGMKPGADIQPWEAGAIVDVTECPFLETETPEGCLSIVVKSCAPDNQPRACLRVNHCLELRGVQVAPEETTLTTEDAWRSRWHLVNRR